MELPTIECPLPNHQQLIRYVCLNQECLENNSFIACQCCIQDEHRAHRSEVSSIKVFLSKIQKLHHQDRKISQSQSYSLSLMSNLKYCKSFKSLQQVMSQIIQLIDNQPYEQVLTQQMSSLKEYSKKFLMEETDFAQDRLSTEVSTTSLRMTQYICPLFVFPAGNHYTLNSAHSVTSIKKQTLTSIKAKPSLQSFPESIEMSFYIKKIKPSWLAVGLVSSEAKQNFTVEDCKGYYLWVSNGWMFMNGKHTPSHCGFSLNEKVTIRYDKDKQLLMLFKNGKFYEPTVIELNLGEWEQLFPCIVFFNKGDQVDLFP